MISLAMLLASGGSTPGGETPPDDGPPGGTPADDLLPALDDPIAMSMRPDGTRIGVVRVGPTREYTTVAAGSAAALLIQTAATSVVTRDHRVDVLIDPGRYPETDTPWLAAYSHVALYAADGQRDSVWLDKGFGQTWAYTYVEGLKVAPLNNMDSDPIGAKYPYHFIAGGTTIISRGSMIANGPRTAIGMDGTGGADTYMYDCRFGPPGQGTNMHGSLDYLGTPTEFIAFIKCSFPGGGFGFSALLDNAADEVWVVDCDAQMVQIFGAAVKLYGDRNTLPEQGRAFDAVRSDWPVPVGGVSPRWRTQLGL